jgi:uncharacterized membrane protein
MPLRTHELHPTLVHLPLTLLPLAAAADLWAALRPRRRDLDRIGRGLWWGVVGSGVAAGAAGMAASQQVSVPAGRPADRMFLHGAVNLALVLSALGVALRRRTRPASFTSAAAGLAASGIAVWTAYLGGELVYGHGAGVKALQQDPERSPPLLSARAPGRLAIDAARGLGWLGRRAYRALTGRERIRREAAGPIEEAPAAVATRH